jgi:hypothetical protein
MRMMSAMALAWSLVACTQMDATGNVTSPVPAAEGPAADADPVVPAPAPDGAGFDFDADEQPDDGPVDPEPTPVEPAEPVQEDGPTPDPDVPRMEDPSASVEPVGEPVAEPVADTPVYAWDPDTAPPATWGIRLLSTVNTTLPPRAVIGLPDGTEEVVQPGAMLPEQSVIVMAVGKDVIEIAQVVPDGVQARVETRTITSLFPQ